MTTTNQITHSPSSPKKAIIEDSLEELKNVYKSNGIEPLRINTKLIQVAVSEDYISPYNMRESDSNASLSYMSVSQSTLANK